MRLIDADKLENVDFSECMDSMEIMAVIDAQLTAYDVDNIIKDLKNVAKESQGNVGMGGELVVNLDDAIEIVRGGVKDETD